MSAKIQRITLTTAQVLVCLLQCEGEMYGRAIIKEVDVKGGTVYPILNRLHATGWIKRRKERIDPRKEGRPPRVFYALTPTGRREAEEVVARVKDKLQTRGDA